MSKYSFEIAALNKSADFFHMDAENEMHQL